MAIGCSHSPWAGSAMGALPTPQTLSNKRMGYSKWAIPTREAGVHPARRLPRGTSSNPEANPDEGLARRPGFVPLAAGAVLARVASPSKPTPSSPPTHCNQTPHCCPRAAGQPPPPLHQVPELLLEVQVSWHLCKIEGKGSKELAVGGGEEASPAWPSSHFPTLAFYFTSGGAGGGLQQDPSPHQGLPSWLQRRRLSFQACPRPLAGLQPEQQPLRPSRSEGGGEHMDKCHIRLQGLWWGRDSATREQQKALSAGTVLGSYS